MFMGHLRKKLEQNSGRPPYIVTDPGVGYRFCADTREDSPE
ncbi:MAG: winged helix-turn-helix domain-containing protein [bacterium]